MLSISFDRRMQMFVSLKSIAKHHNSSIFVHLRHSSTCNRLLKPPYTHARHGNVILMTLVGTSNAILITLRGVKGLKARDPCLHWVLSNKYLEVLSTDCVDDGAAVGGELVFDAVRVANQLIDVTLCKQMTHVSIEISTALLCILNPLPHTESSHPLETRTSNYVEQCIK